MSPTERERIIEEAEKYGFQVPYDGSSEFYDRSAVKAYIAGALAEHDKARNQAIDDILLKVMSFTRYSKATPITINELKEILESLKTKP